MKALLTCVFALIMGGLCAQPVFVKTLGNDIGYEGFGTAYKTSTGGTISVGYTYLVNYDGYAVLTDAEGNEIWDRKFSGSGDDYFWGATEMANGDFILTGTTASFAGGGGDDAWVVRINAAGNLLWSKEFGGSSYDRAWDAIELENGDIMVSAYTRSFGASPFINDDFYVIKLASDGTLIWTKTFGGTEHNRGAFIFRTQDGGVVLDGNIGIGSNINNSLIKITTNGNFLWAKSYGGPQFDETYAIELANGDLLQVGPTYSYGAGDADILMIRTSSTGTVIWSKTYGGPSTEWTYSALELPNGDLVFSAFTYSFGAGGADALAIRTDGSGNLVWARTYGSSGDELAYSITYTTDGALVLGGEAYTLGGVFYDMLLIKLQEDGSTADCIEMGTPALTITSPVIVGVSRSNTTVTVTSNRNAAAVASNPALGGTLHCRIICPDTLLEVCGDTSYVALGYGPEESALLSATGITPDVTFIWSNGATGAEISVNPVATTTYYVTATNADGCMAVDSHVVVVVDVRCPESGSSGSKTKSASKSKLKSASKSKLKSASKSKSASSASDPCKSGAKVVMCHTKSGSKSKKSGGNREDCVKVKSVTKKLAKSGWTLGPCNAPDFESACGEPAYADPCAAAKRLENTESITLSTGMELDAKPNPFSQSTVLTFSTLTDAEVNLNLINLNGSVVLEIYKGKLDAGSLQSIELSGSGLSAGVYFLKMTDNQGNLMTRKVVFTK